MFFKKTCPDCGSVPTNHFLSRVSATVNHIRTRRHNRDKPKRKFRAIALHVLAHCTDSIALFFIRCAVALRVGKIITEPDEKTGSRAVFFWEKALPRGIEIKEFRLFGRPVNTYIATYKSKKIIFDGLPRPEGNLSTGLDWMDDKSAIRRHFIPLDIPMAQGGVARTREEVELLWRSTPKPMIVKPRFGSRSRHTTIHISTKEELEVAVRKAKELSPWVIIEQELRGLQYRGTVIGGTTVAVVRRDPACVFGDGKSTVHELLEKENKNPKRQGPVFHTIAVTKETLKELSLQNLTWDSIPKKNQFVRLGTKASRGSGGGTVDVTAQTHPDNVALFEKVADILADPIVGVDFIISDISQSWKKQDACGVIECNSMPFIDLHRNPLIGETQDVASPIWDMIFPESKKVS